MKQLHQSIITHSPEPDHQQKNVLTAAEFINLLKEEEDYWEGEQHNTKLMITRLRKIFYDKWGWNKELIRGAAKVETRYNVEIVDTPTEHTQPIKRYSGFVYDPKHRAVVYTDHDRVYGNTCAGQPTFIYSNDHQEVLMPDRTFCDLAHILSGLDAHNYPQIVTPMPPFLTFLAPLFPHVSSNMDMATWLGDIASASGDFLIAYLANDNKPASIAVEQKRINTEAPGSDMLGDIDPYVMRRIYDVSSNKGMRFTEILEDYYLTDNPYRKKRFSIFCEEIGLKGWNGASFSNEAVWFKFYNREMRDNITFQLYSVSNEKITSLKLPFLVWLGKYRDVLKYELLLKLFIDTLKGLIKKEPQDD
jgi:hypothetical protein